MLHMIFVSLTAKPVQQENKLNSDENHK